MADAIRALYPVNIFGTLFLYDARTEKKRNFRNSNEVLLAKVMSDVLRSTLQPVYLEFMFHPTRKWRFDGAVPSVKVAVEVEGIPYHKAKNGAPGKSRHMTIGGFLKDKEKYTAAEVMGWHVLRFVWKDVRDGSATKQIVECVRRLA